MSLALAATQSIAGVAGSGSAITITLFGDEISGSGSSTTDAFKVLYQGVLTASATAIYTATGVQALVKTITMVNVTAAPVTVSIYANGTGSSNIIVGLLIPANGKATFNDDGWDVYDANGIRQYVGSTGPTGPKGAQYIGVYSAAVNYAIDNVVTDNGTAWIALAANGPVAGVHAPPTLPTTSNTWWSLLSAKGDRGALYRGIYSGATSYVKDDIVSDNGSSWINILASTGAAPPALPTTSNTNWSLVSAKGDQGNPGLVTTINTAAPLTGGASAATINLGITAATTGAAGTMSAADKTKLDAITGTHTGTNTGDITLTAAGGTPNANAASLSGQALTLQPANASFAGNMSAADFSKLAAITGTHTGNQSGTNTGDITLTTSGTTANANAATLVGQQLQLQTASIAFAGLLSAVDKIKINGMYVGAMSDLGLKNDGTDASGNTTKLQTAMDDATFTNGGVLYFPPGTYAFNDTIIVSKAVIFMGRGRGITVLRMDEAQKTHFALSYGAQTAGFEQLRFTGGPSIPQTGQDRTGRPWKTTIAAASDGVVLAGTGILAALNLIDASGLPSSGVIQFEARFPAGTGTPYWATARYTGKTGNQLTGLTFSPVAQGRTIKGGAGTGDRAQAGGFCIDMGDVPNVYMQQCDILFHKNGVRSAGALQFLDDMNIREMNNAGSPTLNLAVDTSEATASQCVLIDGAGDRYLRRLTTDNAGDWMWMAGVRINQCSSCVMTDCNIINMNWALDIFANAGAATAIASVMALNSFFDSSSIGIRIRCATNFDTAQRIRFVQCWCSTMAAQPTTGGHPAGGIGVTIEHANASSIDFIGCDFFQNPNGGIVVTAAGDWAIRASRISGNGVAGISVSANANNRFTLGDNFIGDGGGFGRNFRGIIVNAGTYLAYNIADNRGLESNGNPTGTGIAIDVGPHQGILDSGTVVAPNEKQVRDNLGTGANSVSGRSLVSQVVAGTALANVTGVSFPIVASGLAYAFDAVMNVSLSTSGASGIGIAIVTPTGATLSAAVLSATSAAAFRNTYVNASATAARSIVTSNGFTGQIRINGMVQAAAATGVVQIQLSASGSASSTAATATVQAGAFIRADKL